MAASYNHTPVVKELLRKALDLTMRTPFMNALRDGSREIFRSKPMNIHVREIMDRLISLPSYSDVAVITSYISSFGTVEVDK